jgi:hypothetical protein
VPSGTKDEMMNYTLRSTYKGASIYRVDHNGIYIAYLEDGMFTYSILRYRADTLKGVKAMVNAYYDRINRLYEDK